MSITRRFAGVPQRSTHGQTLSASDPRELHVGGDPFFKFHPTASLADFLLWCVAIADRL
ncbi:MAG: hypothetical protein F6K30_02150 [Cyanothece sp. SIO2G6]|nr:hypothetical protein [Cyanothece sp. SIO2G6]